MKPTFACRVTISDRDYARVASYSHAIHQKQALKNSRDQQRGDTGSARFTHCLIGKLGEVGAAKLTGGEVDFSIWQSGSRGRDQFEPDITFPKEAFFKDLKLHVKTCNFNNTSVYNNKLIPSGRSSWTVDIADPIYSRPGSKDVIVLMFADDRGRVYGLGWVWAAYVQRLWKPCFAAHMKHKRAIYYSDIQSMLHSF